MADVKLSASTRSEFGKGAARRLRREAKIPAVLYGHGADPIHLALPAHDTFMAMKQANALFEIELDGTTHLAVSREVQRHPVSREIEHVDLITVKRGEKIEVEVQIHIVGDATSGTVVGVEQQTLTVLADATNLPSALEVSVEGRNVGDHILASDVVLPEGAELVTDPGALIVNITAERSAEDVEALSATDAPAESGETPAEA